MPDALALAAALLLLAAHLLDSANESAPESAARRVIPAPRLRAMSVSESHAIRTFCSVYIVSCALSFTSPADLNKGRFAMLLLWTCGSITPMGPCFCITFIVAYIFLSKDAAVSRPVLQLVRAVLSAALAFFWIGQFFAQLGSAWNSSSNVSKFLYADDITSWSWDRILSFVATALTFFLLSPLFKPLQPTGFHATLDAWFSFRVSSKPILTVLHVVGCFIASIWTGLGPTLLVVPALFLVSLALIKCVHRKRRIPIAFALSWYIVSLQALRTLTMSICLAIADSFPIKFDLLYQIGLTTTEISASSSSVIFYDATRHVLLRWLGWFACLILSFQWRNDVVTNLSTRIELVSTADRSSVIHVAGDSFKLFANKFSAETVRFLGCVVMYFVGLADVDVIHAVIFLMAVLYQPLIDLMKVLVKSKHNENLWFWSIIAAYSTALVCFFVIFNLPFIGAPSSVTWGLGLQQKAIPRSWRSFLPIVLVMFVSNLLTAHSLSVIEERSKRKERKGSNLSKLKQPLLSSARTSGMATVAGAGDAATQTRVKQSLLVLRDFIIQFYEFFMRDCFRFCVCVAMLLRGMGVFSAGISVSILRQGYLLIFWMLVFVVAYHQQWNGDAARWTKRVWPLLNVYACLVIGIRYIYYFVTQYFDFFQNVDVERDIGLNRLSILNYNIYVYFGADAVLVVLSFVQSRRFSKLRKTKWHWPESPPLFRFPQIVGLFQNLLSVHGDKGFLCSLVAASLVNGVSVIGWIWAIFFTIALFSHTTLEFSWVVALPLSIFYCTIAIIVPMSMVNFPEQIDNLADPCDTSCLMGFIGFRSRVPYDLSRCPSVVVPFYCINIQSSDQILVSVCIAVSAAAMRLGAK